MIHVLLVEDNTVDVENVRRALAREAVAHRISVATDGHAGLELLHEGRVPRPYLILLDLNLPRYDGLAFLRALRADEELCDSVVFVVTTSNREEDKRAAYGLQAAGYVVKSREGLRGLARLLATYATVVELPPARM
jgi:CheY-like chemotaxis protein